MSYWRMGWGVLFWLGGLSGCIASKRMSDDDADSGTDTSADVAEEVSEVAACEGCMIGATCRPADSRNPDNDCEVCAPVRDRTGWSALGNGLACEDRDPCTLTGVCDGTTCVAPVGADCSHLPPCVASVSCTDKCTPTLAAGTCLIGQTCYARGDAAKDDPCRVCDPDADPLGWSFGTGACDDGDACTYEDTCSQGQCRGQLNPCTDDRECTIDFCDGGQCRHTATRGTCFIDGGCYQDGDASAADACAVCDPATSQTQWSGAVGTPCDDRDACSSSSVCTATGACHGAWDAVDKEPNDTLFEAKDLGDIGASGVFPSGSEPGNLGSPQDKDFYQWGMDFSFIGGGTFVPKVALRIEGEMSAELCVLARCDPTAQDAPTVTCENGTELVSLDAATVGCCTIVGNGTTQMRPSISCGSGVTIPGRAFARVKAVGPVDGATCGGYVLNWGAVAL